MITTKVDWREWAINGTADGERLEDLKHVAREFGRQMARRREEEILKRICQNENPNHQA